MGFYTLAYNIYFIMIATKRQGYPKKLFIFLDFMMKNTGKIPNVKTVNI